MARTGRPGASDDAVWERIRAAHGNKYQYPNGLNKDEKKRILVRCPVHGDFFNTCIPISEVRAVANVPVTVYLLLNGLSEPRGFMEMLTTTAIPSSMEPETS